MPMRNKPGCRCCHPYVAPEYIAEIAGDQIGVYRAMYGTMSYGNVTKPDDWYVTTPKLNTEGLGYHQSTWSYCVVIGLRMLTTPTADHNAEVVFIGVLEQLKKKFVAVKSYEPDTSPLRYYGVGGAAIACLEEDPVTHDLTIVLWTGDAQSVGYLSEFSYTHDGESVTQLEVNSRLEDTLAYGTIPANPDPYLRTNAWRRQSAPLRSNYVAPWSFDVNLWHSTLNYPYYNYSGQVCLHFWHKRFMRKVFETTAVVERATARVHYETLVRRINPGDYHTLEERIDGQSCLGQVSWVRRTDSVRIEIGTYSVASGTVQFNVTDTIDLGNIEYLHSGIPNDDDGYSRDYQGVYPKKKASPTGYAISDVFDFPNVNSSVFPWQNNPLINKSPTSTLNLSSLNGWMDVYQPCALGGREPTAFMANTGVDAWSTTKSGQVNTGVTWTQINNGSIDDAPDDVWWGDVPYGYIVTPFYHGGGGEGGYYAAWWKRTIDWSTAFVVEDQPISVHVEHPNGSYDYEAADWSNVDTLYLSANPRGDLVTLRQVNHPAVSTSRDVHLHSHCPGYEGDFTEMIVGTMPQYNLYYQILAELCHYNLANLLPEMVGKLQGSYDLEEAYPVQAWQQVRISQGTNLGIRKAAWRQDRFWPPFPANGA